MSISSPRYHLRQENAQTPPLLAWRFHLQYHPDFRFHANGSGSSWQGSGRWSQVRRMIIVAIGGALGAVARQGVASLVMHYWKGVFPLGTWLINISGSFVIGLFLTLCSERTAISPEWRLLIAVGFIGAYTTFSTFEYETLRLIESGHILSATLYVLGSVLPGLLAVWAGVVAARRLVMVF